MARYRRTKITTATRESFKIRQVPDPKSSAFCTACGVVTTWLSLSDAAAVRDVAIDELVELIENDRLHSREVSDGRVAVCLSSVLADRASDTRNVTD